MTTHTTRWAVVTLLVLTTEPLHAQRVEFARAAVSPAWTYSTATGGTTDRWPSDTVPDDAYLSAIGIGAMVGAALAAGITWYAVRRSPCTDYCLVDDAVAPFLAAFPGFALGAGIGWLIDQGRKASAAR